MSCLQSSVQMEKEMGTRLGEREILQRAVPPK